MSWTEQRHKGKIIFYGGRKLCPAKRVECAEDVTGQTWNPNENHIQRHAHLTASRAQTDLPANVDGTMLK